LDTLRDGWLHTGDVGMMDHEGYFHLLDRKKDVIISGGENIYSREVEAAVAEHEDVADVAVIGLPDAKWGEAVTAVIIPRRPDLAAAEIEAHSRKLIAGYKTPRRIYFVSEFPRLPSGKINKVELREQLKAQAI
jgi:acyl-CoA synthetase (AMP-forming)/AMP-acid ligase II